MEKQLINEISIEQLINFCCVNLFEDQGVSVEQATLDKIEHRMILVVKQYVIKKFQEEIILL